MEPLSIAGFLLLLAVIAALFAKGRQDRAVRAELASKYAALLSSASERSEELAAVRGERDRVVAENQAARAENAKMRAELAALTARFEGLPPDDVVRHYQATLIPAILKERDEWHKMYQDAQSKLGNGQHMLLERLERVVQYLDTDMRRHPSSAHLLAYVQKALASTPAGVDEKSMFALDGALRAWEATVNAKAKAVAKEARGTMQQVEVMRHAAQAAATVLPGTLSPGPRPTYAPAALPPRS